MSFSQTKSKSFLQQKRENKDYLAAEPNQNYFVNNNNDYVPAVPYIHRTGNNNNKNKQRLCFSRTISKLFWQQQQKLTTIMFQPNHIYGVLAAVSSFWIPAIVMVYLYIRFVLYCYSWLSSGCFIFSSQTEMLVFYSIGE